MIHSKALSFSTPCILLLFLALAINPELRAQPLDPGLPPGRNFNLTNWYLGLPVDSTNGTAGDSASISAAQLTGGYSNALYFYTGPDGAMTFWSPVTGATTEGSTYPRSELREQITPGNNNINWRGYGTHILNAICKVTQVPSTSKVIIGQIHTKTGDARPLVKLQYSSGTIEALVKHYASDSMPNTDNKLIFQNVGLNNPIAYTIRNENGLVTVTVNGLTKSTNTFLTDSSWAAQEYYFKAGSYCQDNVGDTNEGARVAFYSLSRSHAPSITNQPTSITVGAGSTTNFSVQATGNGTLTYQWRLNGTNLTVNATSATLNLANVQSDNAGNYSVRVADTLGAVTSVVATLTVTNASSNNPPTFASDPIHKTNATVAVAYNASLAGDATDPDLGDVLTFSKVSGPLWLSVAGNGVLSGTPGAGDVGTNNWTVRVTDLASASNQATLRIVVSAASSAGSVTNIIVDDSWTDAGRNNGADALDTDWWSSTSSGGNSIEVYPGQLGLISGGSGRGIHGTFASQSLTVGHTLTATFDFTTPATVGTAKSAGFRIGLFDTTGHLPGLESDLTASSGSPNANYNALDGYMMDLDVITGTEDISFRERTNALSGQLMATTADFESLSGGGNVYTFAANTTYRGVISVSRTGSDNLQLKGELYQGATLLSTHTATDTSGITSAFGMLAFHVGSSTFGSSTSAGQGVDNGITFTNIIIKVVSPAPLTEPPAITLQPVSQTNLAGTTATFPITATGTAPLTYQWQKNNANMSSGGNILGATSNQLTLSAIAITDAADYRVIVSNSAGSITSLVATLTVNRPPQPGAHSTVTGQAIPISTSIASLLAVATDPDGDALSIPSVSPASANGGSAILMNAEVLYTPAPGFVGIDQWTYQLTDTRGASSNGVMNVTVVSSNAITLTSVSQSVLPDGSFSAAFSGVPGLQYTVDRATNVTGPWELGYTNVVAAPNGAMQFIDPNTPAPPQRFYRTRYP